MCDALDRKAAWDVCVIGAGPAGSTTARLLADRGLEVLLLDRAEFPRRKVCGCCLNGASLAALDRTGLPDLPGRLGGQRLSLLRLMGDEYQARIQLGKGHYALSRAVFDSALVEAARASGVSFSGSTSGVLALLEENHWTVEVRCGADRTPRSVRSRVVVCADGLEGGALRRHADLAAQVSSTSRVGASLLLKGGGSDLPPGEVRMIFAPEGYAGLVRLEDGLVNVAAALSLSLSQGRTPSEVIGSLLRRHSQLEGAEIVGDVKGTPALTRRRPVGGRQLFIVGDAAGYVEPFTGEGIAWALNSARLLAPLAALGCRDWDSCLLVEWDRRLNRHIRRRQWVCRFARQVLNRPFWKGCFLYLLSQVPEWTRPVREHLNHPLSEGFD